MTEQRLKPLQAPFPWFGGKSLAAPLIWERLGNPPNYVEPFAGSLAVLLGRPHEPKYETVNDIDGFLANFWRATALDPEAVAHHADWPVNENDLHALHLWLVEQRSELTSQLEGNPGYFDAKIAGYWVWGLCIWIGGGWCSGRGPWRKENGRLVRRGSRGIIDTGAGIKRQIIGLKRAAGIHTMPDVRSRLLDLAARLRRVRVASGDFERVLSRSATTCIGLTGVVLDPPYSHEERDFGLYAQDCADVAGRARDWAIAHGGDPLLRIALCGFEGEHDMPTNWTKVPWTASGGYGVQRREGENLNRHREVIWFSPHCLKPAEKPLQLFEG